MLSLLARTALLLPALLAIAGCIQPIKPKGKSPLEPARMSPDSTVLELFFVRFPLGDAEANGRLWQEVDEQHFPPELRQRLMRNGFRVGLVGGQIPFTLSKLMELADKPSLAAGHVRTNLAEVDSKPRVMRRHLQIRAGRRAEIIASGVYERLPVLICQAGKLSGETYTQAQGLLAAKTFPQSDGRVRVELVPELHHSRSRQRWVGDQGVLRLETGRPRRVFGKMAVSATLSPGSMILLSSLPSRPGSLGHQFFTDSDGRPEQKLLVVRLAQTQHDGLFGPPQVLPLEQ